IRGAKTDAEREIGYDPDERPEVSNLVLLAALCLDKSPAEIATSITGGARELKEVVIDAINGMLAPIRARRAEIVADPGFVRKVLREGNERANDIAAETLAQVRAAMRMNY